MSASAAAQPLVSIVVPVFNGEQYLRESLDSILGQTHPELEVLVMDDASTDSTPAIIASYGDRVRHVRQAETRGIYGNANLGIELARGEFVAVYHGDDVYEPAIVEREIAFLQDHPDCGAVFARDVFIDGAGRETGRLVLPDQLRGDGPFDFRAILNGLLTFKNSFLRCPSAMVRTAVHREVGVYKDAEFKNTSDLEMWLRIARRYGIGILDEPLFRYRRGHGSSSERYHHVRTDPERFFTIMDLTLADVGEGVAAPESLAAYEAHRAADQLMIAVSHYILGDRASARETLRHIRLRRLAGSARVQRVRLALLLTAMRILVRLPRLAPVADRFFRRWHDRGAAGAPSLGDAA